MERIQELYEKLPGSWSELTLRDYQKILEVEVKDQDEFEGLFLAFDNMSKIISALTGITVEELEGMPFSQANKLVNKVLFINIKPELVKKGKVKIKTLEEMTYDDFVTFIILHQDVQNNIPALVKTFCADPMTDEDVLNMSMDEVFTAFHLLHRTTKKSVRRMIASSSLKAMKQIIKETWQSILCRFKPKSKRQK